MKNYIRTIAGFPFAVKWFLVTEILFGLGLGIWSISLNFHLKSLGFSEVQIGSVLAVGSVCTAIFSLFAGEFGDRIGFQPALVFGCILKGAGMVIIAVSPNITGVLIGQVVISLGDSLVLSSEFPFLLGLVEEKYRHTVYSLLISTFLFAMFFGNLAGGFMSSWLKSLSKPYMVAVAISGSFFILLGFIRMRLPVEKRPPVPRKFFFHLLKEPKILIFLFYGILTGAVFNLVGSMINIIYREEFKLSDINIGFLFSINTLIACGAAFFVPVIIKKLKVINVASIVQIFIMAALILMAYSPFKIFAVSWILWSFFRTMLPGTMDSAMLQSVAAEQQGAFSGLRVFSNNIGIGIGAYTCGNILMFSNYSMIMLIAAVVVFIQLLVIYFGCRRYLEPKDGE